jgi:exonuclease 1
MHRIRMLRHYGVVPMMVFDGGPLPAKKGTEVERAKWVLDSYMAGMGGYDLLNASPDPRRRREESLAKANALAAQGRSKEARDIYTKCVDVTPEMAYQLIKVSL